MCWALGWANQETLKTVFGKKKIYPIFTLYVKIELKIILLSKLVDGKNSRLCKLSFLGRFGSLVTTDPELFQIINPIIKDGHLNYRTAKGIATE